MARLLRRHTGRRQFTLKFKDLRTQAIAPEAIADVEADLAWAADNRTLLYVEKDPETLLGLYVKKHVLGRGSEARCVDLRTNRPALLHRRLQVQIGRRSFFCTWKAPCRRNGATHAPTIHSFVFKIFLPAEPDHEYDIEHLGEEFIVRSNWQARNFRLGDAPIGANSNRAAWLDVMAHRDDAYIEDFDVFNEFLAVSVRKRGPAQTMHSSA